MRMVKVLPAIEVTVSSVDIVLCVFNGLATSSYLQYMFSLNDTLKLKAFKATRCISKQPT